eukprot:7718881-Alexandrium_andersonii.AAC.1
MSQAHTRTCHRGGRRAAPRWGRPEVQLLRDVLVERLGERDVEKGRRSPETLTPEGVAPPRILAERLQVRDRS